jgi:hypothetical protein
MHKCTVLLVAGLLAIPSLSLAKSKTAKGKAKATATAAAAKGKVKAPDPKPAETKPPETKPAETKPAETKPAGGSSAGKDLFVGQKCNKCHKVSTEAIAPLKDKDDIIDLAGVGSGHEVAWFKQWLRKEIDKDSQVKIGEKVKHKGSWKGTDAELDTITAWLKGLNKKAK